MSARHPPNFARRRGFTLVELVLSVVILSIILLGLQSAALLAGRASAVERDSGPAAVLSAAGAVEQLSTDLTYALSVTELASGAITFTVPDRNNDGADDTIRYAWSGTPGQPLTRAVNGGTPAVVAADVREFALTYEKRQRSLPQTFAESGEVVLSRNDGLGLLNLGDFQIEPGKWCGQVFAPSLPGNAVSWSVTRAAIRARARNNTDGETRVQIRNVVGANVPGLILDERVFPESGLGAGYTWNEFTFSNATGLSPDAKAALVVQWRYQNDGCFIQFQSLLGGAANANFVTTANSGSTWSQNTGADLVYIVYGKYTTANPLAYEYPLVGVSATLRCGADASRRVATTVAPVNQPVVPGP
jgi:prepilin-type N-terminal cleavage/methylation domain-containing protein